MLIAAALIALCWAGCVTVEKAPTDSRLIEAQKVFDEGGRLQAAGQFAKAIPLIERALELREAVLQDSHPEVANCLLLLGMAHQGAGDLARAESLYGRALAIRRATLGKNHPDVAITLNNLAALYASQGLYERAEPLYERALAIWEATLTKSDLHVAASLENQANFYSGRGLWERAEPLYERARTIREAAPGKTLYERALAVREAAHGKSHADVASLLNNLANFYRAQGLWEHAEPLYLHAYGIWEAVLGRRHPNVATSLNNLAELYRAQGFYERAEPLYERALLIREATLGENHPDVAITLNNLAALYASQGLHARTEPLYERALAIREATLGKDHPDVAASLNNLAELYRAQELYARAEPLYEHALAIWKAALGENHPAVATALNNLGNLYRAQGLYARAEPLYERALAIREATLGKDHPDVATSLNNLAALYASQGLYARVRPLYERAITIWEASLGENHPAVATALNNLAELYRAYRLWEHAEPLYERALAIRRAALGENHPDVSTSLSAMAQLRLAQQRVADAVPLFTQAFVASEEHLRHEVYGFSEDRLTHLLQLLRADEERLYGLVHEHPDNAEVRHLALSAALLRKGRSVAEVSNTSRIIYRSLDQAGRETFERLRALRTQLFSLSMAGPGTLPANTYQQHLKDLVAQGDALEEELARRSAPLRRLHALPPASELVNRVAASLPKDGVLIEFIAYRYPPLVPKRGSPDSRTPIALRYLVLLLFPTGQILACDLGLAEPIDAAALRLHHALARSAVSYQSAAEDLYNLAFRPLAPLLGKAQRLFISPDGQLALVPFAALHDGNRFLLDAWDITYLTSGKDLLPRSKEFSPARSVVVLADPDFSAPPSAPPLASRTGPGPAERSASLERFFSSPRGELADQPWPSLPGTRQEAEAIQRLFPHAQLLLGSAATKQALLRLSTPGVLHIATHGFFLDDASAPPATRAVVHFGAGGGSAPQLFLSDPLLRSGLVLAGADLSLHPSSNRLEASLVTALELAGLNLWGTQLVVLSACDTGLGAVRPGEGVYGMRRALVAAGAETLVTSLWKVNDETTRELMEAYYQNLLAGQGRTTALRQAMQALRQTQPHPHFWAPFIAIGKDAPLQGLVP
jgi:CHAT domain-containing protein/lipopolysaccharide biosynthesis regulator YciM